MARRILTFLNAVLASLVVGAMFGTWLRGNQTDLSPRAYVEQQQQGIRALNVTMPILGLAAASFTLASALLARCDRRQFLLLIGATVCLAGAGLVTRFLNQPINAIVITWPPEAPPDNWAALRDEWWQWHAVRTALGLGGLGLFIAAGLVGAAATGPGSAASERPTPSAA